MAAFIIRRLLQKTHSDNMNSSIWLTTAKPSIIGIGQLIQSAGHSSKVRPPKKPNKNKFKKTGQQIDSVAEALASKGYLRAHKQYSPLSNVSDTIMSLANDRKLSLKENLNPLIKFEFLSDCAKLFAHSVPNSILYEINNIDEIVSFYQTPVDTTLPLNAMKKMDLPKNLHIQYDYLRFHPQTDTMFNGQTAFPKSSTLVTGIKYRKKYEGHEAKRSWP